MVASAFRLLGDSDFTARLPAALGGVALVAMAILLRARFGRGSAYASGVLLAVSPTFLYFTRFCREDVWSLLGTFGLFLWLDRWWRTRRVADLGLAAVWGAVAFASKENFYVLGALMAPSVLAAVWEPGSGFPAFAKIRSLLDVLERHGAAILGAVFLFFTLSELAYTLFLVHTDSGNPVFLAISYWWGQHKVETGRRAEDLLPSPDPPVRVRDRPSGARLDRREVAALLSGGAFRRDAGPHLGRHVRVSRREDALAHRPPAPAVRPARRRRVGRPLRVACARRRGGCPGRTRDRTVDALALLLESSALAGAPAGRVGGLHPDEPGADAGRRARSGRSPPRGRTRRRR